MVDENGTKITKGQATSNKILKAASTLFYNRGYQNTAIADIADKAGVAVGTFYLYFKDKYSIYALVLSEFQKKIRDTINTEIAKAPTRLEKERLGLKAWLTFVAEHNRVYEMIWESMYVDKKLFNNYYIKFAEAYANSLHRDHLHLEQDVDLKTVAFMLMGISNFIGLKTVFERKFSEQEIDKMVDDAIKVLDNGLFR